MKNVCKDSTTDKKMTQLENLTYRQSPAQSIPVEVTKDIDKLLQLLQHDPY
jgi:hypothetical protein